MSVAARAQLSDACAALWGPLVSDAKHFAVMPRLVADRRIHVAGGDEASSSGRKVIVAVMYDALLLVRDSLSDAAIAVSHGKPPSAVSSSGLVPPSAPPVLLSAPSASAVQRGAVTVAALGVPGLGRVSRVVDVAAAAFWIARVIFGILQRFGRAARASGTRRVGNCKFWQVRRGQRRAPHVRHERMAKSEGDFATRIATRMPRGGGSTLFGSCPDI